MNFDEFIEKSRVSNDLEYNQDARKIFEFLSLSENVAEMIIFSNIGLPALSGTAFKLEDNFADTNDFPLSNNYNRTIVGRMVRYILSFYGYSPALNQNDKRLRKFSRAKLFKTAAVYEKNKNAKLKIEFESVKII